MTIGEVVDPVMVPVAFAFASACVLWLVWYVARRYRSAPKRVPTNIRYDGRPARLGPKAFLWAAPVAIALVLGAIGIGLLVTPPRADQHVLLALVMLAVAEVTWFAAWTTDRQIELARKMTYRVAPSRLLRALLPLAATIVAIVFVAARPG
jgi:hypothetical protein